MSQFENGEIRPINAQGNVSVSGGIKIFSPSKSNRASITKIILTSTSSYSISLYRHSASTGKKIKLYSLNLNAGDIVSDNTSYYLGEGDSLYLVSNSGSANWSVHGLEYQKNVIQPPFSSGGELRVIEKTGKLKVQVGTGGGGSSLKPLIGVVGDGGEDDPIPGETTFQSDKLIGLGSQNNGRVMIIIDAYVMFNYGSSPSFTLDNIDGILTIDPNVWVEGSGLYIDLNQ